MAYSILCNKPQKISDTYLLYGEYNDLGEAEIWKKHLEYQAIKNRNSTDFDIIMVCDEGTEVSGHVWKKKTSKTDEFWTGTWRPIDEK